MAAPSSSRGIIRFGPFEVDLSAREVRKNGHKIKLQEPQELFNFYLKGGGAKLNEELVKMLKQ